MECITHPGVAPSACPTKEGLGADVLTSPAQARQLFLATFRFSQGHEGLQWKLFSYLIHRHPDGFLDPNVNVLSDVYGSEVAAIICRPNRHAVLAGTPNSQRFRIAETLREQLIRASGIRWKQLPGYSDLLLQIGLGMLERDHNYIVQQPNGRPRGLDATHDAARYDPNTDAWLSHICYYGFLEQTTGLADFDHLFAEVAAVLRTTPLPAEQEIGLHEVIDAYNEHHPAMSVHWATAPSAEYR